jgi:hypothetical protein
MRLALSSLAKKKRSPKQSANGRKSLAATVGVDYNQKDQVSILLSAFTGINIDQSCSGYSSLGID